MVNGVLYTTGGTRRSVVALDGKTGELMWAHSLREGKRAAVSPRQLSGRGVSYWTDGNGDERVIYVTTGYRLVELNAKTGALIPSFGKDGIVDLKVGAVNGKGQQIDLETGEIGIHATPAVVEGRGDRRLVDARRRDGPDAQQHQGPGARVRRAHAASCSGRSTRFRARASSATRRGRTSRGRSTATPASGRRSASTKISASSICRWRRRRRTTTAAIGRATTCSPRASSCVDLKTGQRKWHFQFVHHPIWNFDMSSAPILADITVNGQPIKAVAVADQAGLALRASIA